MCGLNEGDEDTSYVIFQAMEPLLTSEYVHASIANCLGTLLVPFQPLLGGSRCSWSCTLGWNPGVHPTNEGLASVTRGWEWGSSWREQVHSWGIIHPLIIYHTPENCLCQLPLAPPPESKPQCASCLPCCGSRDVHLEIRFKTCMLRFWWHDG